MVKQPQKLLLKMFSTTDPLKYFFFQAIFSLGSLFGCHCQTSPKYFNKHEIYFIRTQKKREKKPEINTSKQNPHYNMKSQENKQKFREI